MDNTLKKKLCERLLWYFGLSNSKKEKVSYISMEEWTYIERWVDYVLGGFFLRLGKVHPNLSTTELHICCLMRLKLRRFHMASLMGISPSTVSTYKFRVKRKIDAQNTSIRNISLESYLLSL
ncbi:hypothetical protein H8S77_12975 [Parabacteroides sp. BX2]|jgi:DNA-binding CsgD family transcriptional regulator|uniref:LuxR family transcriptional regulator n=1 Tax=Parabacteroides segnis TaxID=2763058 RepID=A0ABR7E222_9BACT|nr:MULTISPECIES: hypothetical protein [Parabacteroides]MBC5643801.1 hypothetical protein [Parabacteroides segnis]MCM0716039.1 hypothetical protein [Parabacteroides sp. TA-V-105]